MAEQWPKVTGPGLGGRPQPLERPTPARPERAGAPGRAGPPGGFERVLARELERGLAFSQHAEQRLRSSGIALGPDDLERLRVAVDRAESKGARESLVVMDRLALVVSVANRTVITAVDGERMKDNVFTNIDSAVIVGGAPPGRAMEAPVTGLDLFGGGPGARG